MKGTLVFAEHLPNDHDAVEIMMRVHGDRKSPSGHVYVIYLDRNPVARVAGYAPDAYRRCNEIAGCDLGRLRGTDIERSMGS